MIKASDDSLLSEKRELLVARMVREKYGFFEPLFSRRRASAGDLYDARVLAWKMNARRDLVRFPEAALRAGHLLTIGLIGKVFRYVIRLYLSDVDRSAFSDALGRLKELHGEVETNGTLLSFARHFPPMEIYRDGNKAEVYIQGETDGCPNSEVILEEILLISLANLNNAYKPYMELFDESVLRDEKVYPKLLEFLTGFFRGKKAFGPEGQSLIDMLMAPALASPDSLKGQLEYIVSRWGHLISPLLSQVLTCLDFVREEEKPAFAGFGGMAPVLDLWAEAAGELEIDEERYSPDRDWMSNLVLIAKSVYVWLHQLTMKYGRYINRLDQIPDEELDQLAGWGFTGLWLIGVWERSRASKEIKRRCGNPEAEASAYSLYDYVIADELGGPGALENLRSRAWQRGMRLAADMVPNHVGIYSRWVIEHPDWFIQLDYPPFPSYSYNGPDLSEDSSVSLYIEDGYWNRSDAAVAFKRVDNRSGEVRYIYHGNDGTGLPWNDTAQLNYLIPEVREAAIQSILHVASMFPIIRFDAAMTLSRRHYQRLWFPKPGSGGDIPSRAGHGMSTSEFKRRFPVEFWREVVDRISAEAPDTLLLAEAFWLMEGYFVRTLGMHRVYNSAFMNMLKMEANSEYRQTIKNVMEFDPEILKRFVNFMNNPDEETAVAQFGKGDKYFGTALMMVTMPGLPMFGHGQVEGFTEKYGMEYRRAYRDEIPDEGLVRRHEYEIFPLMRKRWLFSEAQNYTLYDFYNGDGGVNENVFSYSNRAGNERCLIVYNNAYASAAGWIKESAAVLHKNHDGRNLVRRTLGAELGLDNDPRSFCMFTDTTRRLQYIRSNHEVIERGLEVVLGGYQSHVFLDFRQIRDGTGEWAELCRFLNGRGVENLHTALKELFLTPVHQAFRSFFNPDMMRDFLVVRSGEERGSTSERKFLTLWEKGIRAFMEECRKKAGNGHDKDGTAEKIMRDLHFAVTSRLPQGPENGIPAGIDLLPSPAAGLVPEEPSNDLSFWRLLLSFIAVRRLGEIAGEGPDHERGTVLFEEWLLNKEVQRAFRELGCGEETISRELLLLKNLIHYQTWLGGVSESREALAAALEEMLRDADIQKYLGVNRYRGIIWFVKERFEELVSWLHLAACLDASVEEAPTEKDRLRRLGELSGRAGVLLEAAEKSGFMIERLIIETLGTEQPA